MIQLSSLLPAIPHGPVRPAALDPAGASSFALAMSALVLPRAAVPQPQGEADPLLPVRQPLAEAGKDLPEGLVESDAEADPQADDPDLAEDAAFAWFAIPLPVDTAPPAAPEPSMPAEQPTLAPMAHTTAPASLVSATVETLSPLVADPVQPAAGPEPAKTPTAPPTPFVTPPLPQAAAGKAPVVEAAPIDVAPLADAPPEAGPLEAVSIPGATPRPPASRVAQEAPRARVAVPVTAVPSGDAPTVPHIEAPIRRPQASVPAQPVAHQASAPRPAPFQPVTAPIAPPVVAPALAAAIEAAVSSAPAVSAPSRRAPAIEPAVIALAPSAEALRPHAVAAAADVEQGVIDMRRQEWMGQMVEQIEAMRDATPVRETRLSLAPEALGKVDISIRQEGEHVHVHFATETPAARQLIADAQPRLSELAEARGLKLGQASFESGTAGQGGRDAREQFAQPQSLKPRPASSPSDVGTPDDDRIA